MLEPGTRPASRLRRWARWVARSALTLAVCFLVLELGVRFYVLRWHPQLRELARTFRQDPATGFSLAPNRMLEVPNDANAGHHTWHMDTNAQGLRGPEVAPRAPSECRILVLGGSYVYGIGVEAAEAAPALLEARLRGASAHPVRVINAGAPGFGLGEQYRQYLARGPELDPDGVVLPYLQRDDLDGLRHFTLVDGMLFTDPLLFAGHPSFVVELFAGDNIYVKQSYEGLRHFFKHVIARRPDDVVPRRATRTFDPAVKSWELIEDVEKLAASRRQPFLLANFPFWEKSRFYSSPPAGEPPSAKTPSVPWAQDFFPVFWNAPSSPYLEGDHHWNALGHRLVADALLPWASEVCRKVWAGGG